MKFQKGDKLVHNYYDMSAEVIDIFSNGNFKIILTDNTAPSAKLRKPKNSTIDKAFTGLWSKSY